MRRATRVHLAGLLAVLCAGLAAPRPAAADSAAAVGRDLAAPVAADSAAAPGLPAAPVPLVVEEDGQSYAWMAVRLVLGLAAVVLLAVAALHLLRRSGLARQWGAPGGHIRVVERVYLGPKRQICLVEIGGRALALGVTEERIQVLARWAAGELVLPPPPVPAATSFAAQLKGLVTQGRADASGPEGERR